MESKDVIDFFKNKQGGIVIRSFKWWGPLRSRILALTAWKRNYFTFAELFRLMLPLSSPAKRKLMERFSIFLQREALNEYCADSDGFVNLFGRRFRGPDFHETLKLIFDVVFEDQYRTSQYLKKDSIIIDAGANIGVFSILAANIAKEGRIFAFEPVAKTYQYLKDNTHSQDNILAENLGLGDENATKNIFVNSQSTGISVLEDSGLYSEKSERDGEGILEPVTLITLDHYVKEKDIARIDFIKIDTEGYEAKVLQGAKEVISRDHPMIAMSAYHNPKDKEELPRLLNSIAPGYVCQLHKGAEEDFICYFPQI